VSELSIIIFAALAIIIFLKLRSVMGQRTGRGRRRNDRYSAPDASRTATNDKVILLSRRADTAPTSPKPVDAPKRWNGVAKPNSPVATGLDAIARKDNSFDAQHFVDGAQTAYEMIVLAYAKGDRRTLRNLLSRKVYEDFEATIEERESSGEMVETRFVSIEKPDIIGVELRRNRMAQITVRFVSKLISVTRDRAGTVVDGDPERATDIADIWTFARDLSSRDPNWKLTATEAEQ
jgi:predicted lipid-binding transport protein (Tim44 family)